MFSQRKEEILGDYSEFRATHLRIKQIFVLKSLTGATQASTCSSSAALITEGSHDPNTITLTDNFTI